MQYNSKMSPDYHIEIYNFDFSFLGIFGVLPVFRILRLEVDPKPMMLVERARDEIIYNLRSLMEGY